MQIKLFTLRFSARLDGFDDEPVRAFLSDHPAVRVHGEFFLREGIPYWTLLVQYGESPPPSMPAESAGRKNRKENYREILTEAATPAFNRLREWRTQRARNDAVPPYVLFTNRQLAEIAVRNPESLSALSAVEGVGNAKLSQYGKEVLACLRSPKKPQEKSSDKPSKPSPPPLPNPEISPDGP